MAKNSGPVRTVHARTTGKERDEMIATTKAEIEKKFGQGSIMRYGDGGPELEVEAIPTGSLALDAALGIGGVPRGRIVEIYGPESSGKTTLSLEILAEAQAMGGVVAFIDAEHALDPTPMPRASVLISMRSSFPSPIRASRRSRSSICLCAPVPSTPSSSTLLPP